MKDPSQVGASEEYPDSESCDSLEPSECFSVRSYHKTLDRWENRWEFVYIFGDHHSPKIAVDGAA